MGRLRFFNYKTNTSGASRSRFFQVLSGARVCVSANVAWRALWLFACVRVRAHTHARARGVVRESDADSGVTLGLPVFLLSMKGMT